VASFSHPNKATLGPPLKSEKRCQLCLGLGQALCEGIPDNFQGPLGGTPRPL
jgi:hypothetical protein